MFVDVALNLLKCKKSENSLNIESLLLCLDTFKYSLHGNKRKDLEGKYNECAT